MSRQAGNSPAWGRLRRRICGTERPTARLPPIPLMWLCLHWSSYELHSLSVIDMGFVTSLGAWAVPQPALPRLVALSSGPHRPTPQRMGGSAGASLFDTPITGALGTRGARPARHQLPAAPTTCALRAAARRLHHGACCLGPLRCIGPQADAETERPTPMRSLQAGVCGGQGGDFGLLALLPPSAGDDDPLKATTRALELIDARKSSWVRRLSLTSVQLGP